MKYFKAFKANRYIMGCDVFLCVFPDAT